MEEKTTKIVFNPGLARHLLKAGCTIVDIKASKEDPKMTVFVFKKDEIFNAAMEESNKQIQAAKIAE